MSDASRRPIRSSRPYGSRPVVARPIRQPVVVGPSVGGAGLSGALGAIGGTLGCLLCLAAIGALGLFACVIAITAYTKQFLDQYKRTEGVSAVAQVQMGIVLLVASLLYTMFSRIQRS